MVTGAEPRCSKTTMRLAGAFAGPLPARSAGSTKSMPCGYAMAGPAKAIAGPSATYPVGTMSAGAVARVSAVETSVQTPESARASPVRPVAAGEGIALDGSAALQIGSAGGGGGELSFAPPQPETASASTKALQMKVRMVGEHKRPVENRSNAHASATQI